MAELKKEVSSRCFFGSLGRWVIRRGRPDGCKGWLHLGMGQRKEVGALGYPRGSELTWWLGTPVIAVISLVIYTLEI